MDLLQRQAYHLWFNWLADKIMEWKDAKPLNTDLKNCIKAMNEIGMFTNQLQTEVEVLHKRVSLIRQQKNELIQKQREQIEELENKLKDYNMEYEDIPDEITYCRTCGKETNDKTYCSQNCKDYDLE
jgi:predicted RNase H-like nuclease (RuvC/YqgF family)